MLLSLFSSDLSLSVKLTSDRNFSENLFGYLLLKGWLHAYTFIVCWTKCLIQIKTFFPQKVLNKRHQTCMLHVLTQVCSWRQDSQLKNIKLFLNAVIKRLSNVDWKGTPKDLLVKNIFKKIVLHVRTCTRAADFSHHVSSCAKQQVTLNVTIWRERQHFLEQRCYQHCKVRPRWTATKAQMFNFKVTSVFFGTTIIVLKRPNSERK